MPPIGPNMAIRVVVAQSPVVPIGGHTRMVVVGPSVGKFLDSVGSEHHMELGRNTIILPLLACCLNCCWKVEGHGMTVGIFLMLGRGLVQRSRYREEGTLVHLVCGRLLNCGIPSVPMVLASVAAPGRLVCTGPSCAS